jgi:hypothetical protein
MSDGMQSVYCEKEIFVRIVEQDFQIIGRSRKQFADEVDEKIYQYMINCPLGDLGESFINLVNSNLYHRFLFKLRYRALWDLAVKVDQFLNAYASEKNMFLHKIELELDYPLHESVDRNYIKKIYLSNCPELINIFKCFLPIRPIEVFEPNNIPAFLAERLKKKTKTIAEFTSFYEKKSLFEKTVISVQRRLRSKLRHKSELMRIENLYFKNISDIDQRKKAAVEAIHEANALYRPQKCSVELAEKILRAVEEIKLYTSVKHFTATKNIASILDDCLFGRKNLIDGYINFRPAALGTADIVNGDLNVICMGPDKIDEKCLRERTVCMEFDLDLIACKNPNIFFKQKDFGYNPETLLSINIGFEKFLFSHIKSLRFQKNNYINFQLFGHYSHKNYEFYSELPMHNFISYNLPKMHQILTLNFFRFIDSLKDVYDSDASEKIAHIYKKISELNDEELRLFLTEIGQKMSCTSEFNFTGAYKIDLQALTHLSFYLKKEKVYTVDMRQLCEQIDRGDKSELEQIMTFAPEILNSKRFVEYLNI